MYSRLVSLKPPFLALVRGVRMARVMTMSSGFLDWLWRAVGQSGKPIGQLWVIQGIATYMEFRDEPGARWRMMDPMRSAMVITAGGNYNRRREQTDGKG
jgi:hypothetical protein